METMNQVQQEILATAAVSPQATAAVSPQAMAGGDLKGGALEAARALAAALAETPEYKAYDRAEMGLRHDKDAQEAIRALQERQLDLGWKQQMGLTSEAEREELQRLQQAMMAQPAVQTYVDAQKPLAVLCHEVSELVTESIGLSFAASCGPGCSCH